MAETVRCGAADRPFATGIDPHQSPADATEYFLDHYKASADMEVVMVKSLAVMLFFVIGAGAVSAQEVTYRSVIAPLWRSKCIACHGAQSPERADFLLDEKGYADKSQGPRMDSYERFIAFIAWPDTGALMRRLDDGTSQYAGGKPGNMYLYLGSTDEERAANLKLVKAWVGEGAWNLNRWSKRGDVPAISKEQLDRIKVKY